MKPSEIAAWSFKPARVVTSQAAAVTIAIQAVAVRLSWLGAAAGLK
jgi:hypothetical protein